MCDALYDLVPFVQFKKREKHPWKSVTFNKVAFFHGCFSRFLNCANGTKSRNTSHYNEPLSGQGSPFIPLVNTKIPLIDSNQQIANEKWGSLFLSYNKKKKEK